MPITETRQFGNHKFIIITGIPDASGVVIHPDTAAFISPGFIEDMKTALKAYPDIEAYNYIYELYKSPPGDLRDFPEHMLDSVLENWNKFSRSEFITITKKGDLFGYVQSVEEEIKYRHRCRSNNKTPKPKKKIITDSPRNGFVYLVQSSTGAYKIGRTINPHDRIRTFNVKLPFEVEYVVVIETANMYSLESELHNQFARKRVNGEWFQHEVGAVEED